MNRSNYPACVIKHFWTIFKVFSTHMAQPSGKLASSNVKTKEYSYSIVEKLNKMHINEYG